MLALAKNDTAPFDFYSLGDGSDPASTVVTTDGSRGTVNSLEIAAYLVATEFRYTDIVIQPLNEQAGVEWQVSLDGSTWAESVAPAELDALDADTTLPVWLRAVVDNDGSVATSILTAPDIEVTYIERPE